VLGSTGGALVVACVLVVCCLWWFRPSRLLVARVPPAPVEHVFWHLARGEAPVDAVFAARQSNWADF